MLNIIIAIFMFALGITMAIFLVVDCITDVKEWKNLKKYSDKLDLEIEEINMEIELLRSRKEEINEH